MLYEKVAIIAIPRSGSHFLIHNILMNTNYKKVDDNNYVIEDRFALLYSHNISQINNIKRVILLDRKDKIKQAISYYISNHTNIWFIKNNKEKSIEDLYEHDININNVITKIDLIIKYLTKCYTNTLFKLNKYKTNYMVYYYEDIIENKILNIKNIILYLFNLNNNVKIYNTIRFNTHTREQIYNKYISMNNVL